MFGCCGEKQSGSICKVPNFYRNAKPIQVSRRYEKEKVFLKKYFKVTRYKFGIKPE